jgi:peptidyl-tRNA hydrolase, PTH1 family
MAMLNRNSPSSPWLIVGLGNPGAQYAATPHNLGYMVVEILAEQYDLPLAKKTHQARWGKGRLAGVAVILAQPTTYMNLSGRAVLSLLHYFDLAGANLVVIHDDLDVPGGRVKLAWDGGAGGHRGVASVAAALRSPDFYRVKLGIGRPPPGVVPEDFVLRPFPREAWEDAAGLVDRGARAVVALITAGLAAAQNQFHREGPDSA